MCGKNAEQGAFPADEWSGLDRAKSSRCCDPPMRNEEGIGVDVCDEHRLSVAHSPATGRIVLAAHRCKVLKEIDSKTTLDDNAEGAGFAVEELNIAQVRALHDDSHREKVPQLRVQRRRDSHQPAINEPRHNSPQVTI